MTTITPPAPSTPAATDRLRRTSLATSLCGAFRPAAVAALSNAQAVR
jgi:hypothetical protein